MSGIIFDPVIDLEEKFLSVEKTPIQVDALANVGGAHMKRLKTAADLAKFSSLAVGLLVDPDIFKASVIASNSDESSKSFTEPQLAAKLSSEPFSILSAFSHSPLAYIRIFLVSKKATLNKRVIAHPKFLNSNGKRPPKLHLWSVESLLFTLFRFAPKWYTIELDLRNFFYQFSIPDWIRAYMCTFSKSAGKWQLLALKVLCMGWTWSPYIAQSISWLIILFKLDGEKDLFHFDPSILEDISPPPFILFEGGFITIIYDNFLVVSTCSQLRDQILSRIRRNFSFFNIIPKYINTSCNYLSFNGIQAKKDEKGFRWCIDPETFNSWLDKSKDIHLKRSPSNIAALQSILICHHKYHRLSLRPHGREFAKAGRIFQIFSLKPKKMWKRALKQNTPHLEVFDELRHKISNLSNDWTSFTKICSFPTRILAVAVDATPTGLGIVLIDFDTGEVVPLPPGFDGYLEITPTEIYISESKAINRGVAALKTIFNFDRDADLLLIVTDNTTSGRAYAKGWSGNAYLDKEISEFDGLREGVPFLLVDTPSLENAANEASRNQGTLSSKVALTHNRMTKALKLFHRGFVWVDRRLI